jgi:hypothetical protein
MIGSWKTIKNFCKVVILPLCKSSFPCVILCQHSYLQLKPSFLSCHFQLALLCNVQTKIWSPTYVHTFVWSWWIFYGPMNIFCHANPLFGWKKTHVRSLNPHYGANVQFAIDCWACFNPFHITKLVQLAKTTSSIGNKIE